jgi:hypothetical protein
MPIGGNDPGAFLYSQLQKRLGKSVMTAPGLPSLMSNQRQIDLFNEQMRQIQAFTGNAAPVEQLASFNPDLGTPESAYGLGVQLANIETLLGSSRFRDVFSIYQAVTDQKLSNPALDQLRDFAKQGTKDSAAKATELLAKNPELKEAAEAVIKNAQSAAGFSNSAGMLSKLLPQIVQAMGIDSKDPMVENLTDVLSELSGLKRDPSQFSSAAIQSLSMMGSLGTAISGQDVMGRPIMAADRITSEILSKIEAADSPFSGIKNIGMARAGEMMNELAKSGILTSGGVDTFGAIKPEDVKKLEEAIAVQLEGFSEVAAAGKRLGLKIPEIIQSMQRIHRGQFGRALDDAAGKAFEELSSQVGGAGPMDDQTRLFLETQAQKKAGVSMMQQVEKAVQLGRFAGLGARESMVVLETSAQLTESLGLSGAAGIETGSAAMARVALSRTMGTPVTIEQAMAQETDIFKKAQQNPSSKAYASLMLAIDTGILKADDPKVKKLLDDYRAAKNIDIGEVAQLISSTGASPNAFMNQRAVLSGMSLPGVGSDIRNYYAGNEDVNLIGTIKRSLNQSGIDAESLTRNMATGGIKMLASAFRMEEGDVAKMDFLEFAVKFNEIQSQPLRIKLLEDLVKVGAINSNDKSNLLTVFSNANMPNLAGDSPGFHIALIRLREELERRNNGGITNAEAQAQAVAKNQADLNKLLMGKKPNSQVGVSSALESIRNDKINKYKQSNPGATDEQARNAVNEIGFTFQELIQAASGVANVELQEALNSQIQTLEAEIKQFTSAGNVKDAEVATRALVDAKHIRDAMATNDIEEKKRILKEIQDRNAHPNTTLNTPTPEELQKIRDKFDERVNEYIKQNPGVSEADAKAEIKKKFENEYRDLIFPVEAPPPPATTTATTNTTTQINSSVPPVTTSGSAQSSSRVKTGASGQSSSESGIMEGPTTKSSEPLDTTAKTPKADQVTMDIKKTMDDIKLHLSSLVKLADDIKNATQVTAQALS